MKQASDQSKTSLNKNYELDNIYERGHPYTTSEYFWSFWTPPTNTVQTFNKNGHFLDTPTLSFCWRNIGMAPNWIQWPSMMTQWKKTHVTLS